MSGLFLKVVILSGLKKNGVSRTYAPFSQRRPFSHVYKRQSSVYLLAVDGLLQFVIQVYVSCGRAGTAL
jgi:hypothetical protein